MPRRIVIIQGHPDSQHAHLGHALADAYAAGAQAAGHTITRIDLGALDIPLLRSQDAFEHGTVPDSLKPAADAIVAAEHIVLIFPLWLGTMPAMVKAFLEQVMRPGIAFAYRDKGGQAKPLLAGRSARVIVTMGMPALVYRWWFGAHGVKALERNILAFVGIAPIRRTLFGMVEAVSPAKRRDWVERMRKLGARGD